MEQVICFILLNPYLFYLNIIQPQFQLCLGHETGFLAVGIDQGKRFIRVENCQGNSRQAGTTSHIQNFLAMQQRLNRQAVQ